MVLGGLAPSVWAQDGGGGIPANAEAELRFEAGLAAFERGDYDAAAQRFRSAADYGLTRTTTAALLMLGKARYRQQRYRAARDALETLVARYPSTSYRAEAKRLIGFATEAVEARGGADRVLRLGIALPLRPDDIDLTQALFNGIRLAVDEANGIARTVVDSARAPTGADVRMVTFRSDSTRRAVAARPTGEQVRPVQMVFRSTGTTPEGARQAVDSLVTRDRVDLIVGPLYSRSARAAAAEAERSGVVMVAPLATDEAVSEGRDFVFQANPTRRMRGRLMARFAARGLLIDMAAIFVEEGNAVSERMAEGFRAEAREVDMGILFHTDIENPREWSQLPEKVARDTLALVDAVYLPIAGQNAAGRIQDALTGLDRLRTEVRVLGNAEWHDLAVEQEASLFSTTYTNDFYVDETRPEVQAFARRHRLLTGAAPDELPVTAQRLAFTGYDVARFLLQAVPLDPRADLRSALRNAPRYEGLGMRIDFDEDGSGTGNVNEAVFYHRYGSSGVSLLR